jgi:MoaA/NifB/PqqE/SkfB family radical SAM enzyme
MIRTPKDFELDVNLLLNSTCNIRCSYCSAIEQIEKASKSKQISLENFIYVAELMQQQNLPHINLIGGEPSLHPQVFDFLEILKAKPVKVGFSTNATWNSGFREKMQKHSENLEFEVTLNPESTYKAGQFRNIMATLESLSGKDVSLGCVIHEGCSDYSLHLELAKKHGFGIRWTLAEPTIGAGNLHFYYNSIEELRKMGNEIYRFIGKCDDKGIYTWLDLEVPACIFSENQLNFFRDNPDHDIQFHCPPFFDIAPDLTIWKCFALSPLYTANLKDFGNIRTAHQHLTDVFEKLNSQIIFDECGNCSYYHSNECNAGPKVIKHYRGKR